MADKRCENGHFIDDSWDLCPYCPVDINESEMPIVRPSRLVAPEPARAAAQPERHPITGAIPPLRDASAEPIDRTVALQRDPGLQPKRYVVGWLIGLNGAARGESFPVRMGRNVLGRDRRSDVVVNDDQASSHHADLVFRPEERRFILMDHNSTNGTYVNEGEIEPRRDLAASDIIRIGSHRFFFMPLCHEGLYWDDEGALK